MVNGHCFTGFSMESNNDAEAEMYEDHYNVKENLVFKNSDVGV